MGETANRIDDAAAAALLTAARGAAAGAYAPYSAFPVGAAVLTADGTVVTGCNIENASYGLTVCGERVAIWTAVAAGHRTLRAVAVVTPAGPGATPCGACRQVLNEFAPIGDDPVVILETERGAEQVPLSTLLPRAFGPRDVPVPEQASEALTDVDSSA